MFDRLFQLYDSATTGDFVQVAVLAVGLYMLLRFLGKTRGAGIVRGLGLVVVGLFLVAQVLAVSLELTVLSRVLDYVLTTGVLGLLVIFQQELRRGLMILGRSRWLRYFVGTEKTPVVDKLAEAAAAMSAEYVGALIVLEREMALAQWTETGVPLDAELSPQLIRTIFAKRTPLHDGAVIVTAGRVAAAACQLPLGQVPEGATGDMGMRHRSALCMSEETDAVVLVVSEETGRISLGIAGKLTPVPAAELAGRLTSALAGEGAAPAAAEKAAERSAA